MRKHALLKRVSTVALSMVLSLSICAFGPSKPSYADSVTYEKGSSTGDLVDVMQSYGFIAFNTLSTSGHQHMNAIAGTLTGSSLNGEFNIRKDAGYTNPESTTYIQNFESLSSNIKIGTAGDTLVVGSQYAVTGAGQKSVDGHIVDSASNVYADTATKKYIDLVNLQKSFVSYSQQLAETTTNTGASINSTKNAINVSLTSGTAYLNLNKSTLEALNADSDIVFPANSTSVIVLNIDMNGLTSWPMGKWFRLMNGDAEVSCGENVYNLNINRIYYNFYDSSKEDKQYTGSISADDKGWGTLLAPKASISVGSNFCGVIIGNNVSASGESHRSNAYNPVTPKTTNTPTEPVVETSKLIITVIDEKTNAKVPGAKVKVTDSKGNETEYTTDKDGKITITSIPVGTTTLTVTQVPTGYTVTTNKTITTTVVSNKTTSVEAKITNSSSGNDDSNDGKDGNSNNDDEEDADGEDGDDEDGDDEDGDSEDGDDEDGNDDETDISDDKISKNNTTEAVTTETTTTETTTASQTNTTTTSTSNSPKTGDTTNPFVLVIIMELSLLGFVVIAAKKHHIK